jgi:large subunit ribosomal protein L2
LANKEEKYATLKMPSGELRKILINCYATVGEVSNSDHSLESKGKASGGHPRSRTGKYAKGEITRTRGKGSDKMIIQRRNGKKLPNK